MAGKVAEFIAKTYLVEENLTNFLHYQTKNYENYVIRHIKLKCKYSKQATAAWLMHQNMHFAP